MRYEICNRIGTNRNLLFKLEENSNWASSNYDVMNNLTRGEIWNNLKFNKILRGKVLYKTNKY